MVNDNAVRELMPFQPATTTPAQLAAVPFFARYPGPDHHLHAYQLRRRFAWFTTNGTDALISVERAHVERHIRSLTESGLMASSIVTLKHSIVTLKQGACGYFRFAHIDGLTSSHPAVYARLPKVHRDQSAPKDSVDGDCPGDLEESDEF